MKSVFARNLIKIRQFHELTQQQASDKIGIKRCTLAAYEEGRAEPSIQLLLKICKGYCIENISSLLWNESFLGEGAPEAEALPPMVAAYNKANIKEKEIVKLILGL